MRHWQRGNRNAATPTTRIVIQTRGRTSTTGRVRCATVTMTYENATAAVMAAPQFELAETSIHGVLTTVYKNAPANLAQVFMATRAHGDATSLVYEGERYSFSDVMGSADALGAALVTRYGVAKGDRVAIAMRNYPEWVISFIAVTSIGGICVSLNSWWTADELAYAISDSTPRVLIGDEQRLALAADACKTQQTSMLGVRLNKPVVGVDRWEDVLVPGATPPSVEIGPDDDATILYTSGTTGSPKGAVSTHRAVISALMSFACRQTIEGIRAGIDPTAPTDPPSFILIVPLFHVTGCVAVMMSCLVGGAKLVIMYKWDVDKALEIIEREQITNFVGVPTQAWDLVHAPRFADYDTSSLRSIGGGGAPAPPAQVALVAKSFPKGSPGIGYGMTETNAYGPQNTGDDYLTHPSSAGRFVPAVQVEVRDADGRPVGRGQRGEIFFKGPNLIRGYWGKPKATAETIIDGWLASGDIGIIDDDGFVYVVDRAKDMILRGGENIYCAEVEAAIYEHPSIHEAAVYGIPHERLGEEVGATIVLQPGTVLSADDLRAYLQQKLASFKVPAHVRVSAAPLPRNAAGKFLKRELRDRAISG